MYRSIIRISLLSAAVVMMMSCRDAISGVVGGRHPFVDKVLNDSTETGHAVLARYDRMNRKGAIALVGPSDECAVLSDYLTSSDIFDNVDGRKVGDWLPDFAGETIESCMDMSNVPYSQRNEDEVTEMALRGALFAVSDSCYLPDGIGKRAKRPAKIVLLSSSVMSVSGYKDVDTLFAAVGLGVPVISHAHVLAEQAYGHSVGGSRIGVWAEKDVLAAGVYTSVFHDMSVAGMHMDYVCYSPEGYYDIKDGFRRFLDMYGASSGDMPLSVLLIDDIHLSSFAGGLDEYAASLRADVRYSGLLADDFRVIDALSAMAAGTFRVMRERNSFTHKVALPETAGYVAESGQELERMRYVCK